MKLKLNLSKTFFILSLFLSVQVSTSLFADFFPEGVKARKFLKISDETLHGAKKILDSSEKNDIRVALHLKEHHRGFSARLTKTPQGGYELVYLLGDILYSVDYFFSPLTGKEEFGSLSLVNRNIIRKDPIDFSRLLNFQEKRTRERLKNLTLAE